jgi:hypothetical protein
MSDDAQPPDDPDVRLYALHPEGWQAHLKTDWGKEFCFLQNPDEEFFHHLMFGEIYITNGDEKLCLRCAHRRNVITTDRLSWQHRANSQQKPIV